MKITPLALLAFLSTVDRSGAFVPPTQVRQDTLQLPILHSLTAPIPPGGRSNRSETELDKEHEDIIISAVPAASNGKILEGGKVIDFESLRGPSMAENALEEAKAIVAKSTRRHGEPHTGILGINQEVIAEVGHELGTFATSQDIQNCAAYLRSKAASGFFEQRTATTVVNGETLPSPQKAEFDRILRQAYLESGEVTSAFAKTFYLGTQLLPEASREAIWAIYVWCRRTDEIVDAPRDSNEEMLQDLGAWEMRLENLWKYGEVADVYDLCLLDVLVKYPTLPITPFMDMIRGMLMDVPQLGQDRYDSFNELHLYCYRVAGTVGLMCLPVFGCAEGWTEKMAKEPALSLGVAFQLTNILRDVGEDAVKRGRVYLPQEDLDRFGVTEDQLFEQRVDENYINMMKFQIARARMYYERARRGVFMLAPESRLPVQSSLDAYGKILDKIEENGYDSLTKRAYVDKWEKLSIIPFSWYRTQDASRFYPLPGDKPIPDLKVEA
ncbi:phytoene synthase [Nitzschia inconspicua]|uniref:15-cis-phytoene synthase n=1 Tax=Nitzschia inconspicua TaxID=303405 RepID=A0A9K3L6H8_9STRA|nr:phytoene synthase [Nitzschia inconspicua]